jgi:putative transposase
MPRRKRETTPRPLTTIWGVSDDLWAEIEPIPAEYDPPKRVGRKRIDQRRALDGIIYRMRSGVQWNQLLKEFGDNSSVHRTFQHWVELGVFERIWATLVEKCQE